jgi:hypothetical protein
MAAGRNVASGDQRSRSGEEGKEPTDLGDIGVLILDVAYRIYSMLVVRSRDADMVDARPSPIAEPDMVASVWCWSWSRLSTAWMRCSQLFSATRSGPPLPERHHGDDTLVLALAG